MNEELSLTPMAKVRVGTLGAEFEADMEFTEWLKVGRQFGRLESCCNFIIGDWINFGELSYVQAEGAGEEAAGSREARRKQRKQKYVEALQVTGIDYQYLADMAWVAGKVGLSNRFEKLTWRHHREVAVLKAREQRRWLQLAADGAEGKRWTVSQLRQAIRASERTIRDAREPNPDLMEWAKPAGDLTRSLKKEISEEPIEAWPTERKEAMREELKELKEIIDRLWL